MENKQIPGWLLRKWESAATKQHLSQSEFIIYIRDREKEYLENLDSNEKSPIMENGMLTKRGEKEAINYYRSMDKRTRAIIFSKVDFSMFSDSIEKRGINKDLCLDIIDAYNILRDRMKEYRISKEEMMSHRLNYKEVLSIYNLAKSNL